MKLKGTAPAFPESDRHHDVGPDSRLHFLGVCGKGMGPIAVALADRGWRVTGSDEATYPPMSGFLEESGVDVRVPYAPANIPEDVDLCIVGKRLREDNQELQAVLARGLPFASFPSFLRDAFLSASRNAVVAGGVGKTTTTAMLAWIMEATGNRPDYLIGGMPRNLPAPARFAKSAFAVLEGDEYASCFDDPRPKFLKYNAEVAIVTNIIEDHPDLYADTDAVTHVFADLIATLPDHGLLIVPDADPATEKLRQRSPCRVRRVGFSETADLPIADLDPGPDRTGFRLDDVRFDLPMVGRMNVMNAAMAAAAAEQFGVSFRQSSSALPKFLGVANRQTVQRVGSLTQLADKASHPHALAALFESVRQAYPDRRLVSVIRPRATGGRDWVYQRDLPAALAKADLVVLLPAYEHKPPPGTPWADRPFSMSLLESEVAALGTRVIQAPDSGNGLSGDLQPDDVVVVTLPEQDKNTEALIAAWIESAASGMAN